MYKSFIISLMGIAFGISLATAFAMVYPSIESDPELFLLFGFSGLLLSVSGAGLWRLLRHRKGR